jgi:hypothetical protein
VNLPVQILLLVREKKASDWITLCQALGQDPTARHTGTYVIAQAIEDLKTARLLNAGEMNASSFRFPKGVIEVAPNIGQVQHVLGISFKALAQTTPGSSMFVEPFFGTPDAVDKQNHLDLFMLMPFRAELRPVYDDHIKAVVNSLGMTIKRGDDFFTSHQVMRDIWSSICAARAIVADCTGRNPNVFYEIGMAHSVGKPVVLLTQNNEDVPFDLRHIRYIQYSYTPPGMKQFEVVLAQTIKQIFAEMPENRK